MGMDWWIRMIWRITSGRSLGEGWARTAEQFSPLSPSKHLVGENVDRTVKNTRTTTERDPHSPSESRKSSSNQGALMPYTHHREPGTVPGRESNGKSRVVGCMSCPTHELVVPSHCLRFLA